MFNAGFQNKFLRCMALHLRKGRKDDGFIDLYSYRLFGDYSCIFKNLYNYVCKYEIDSYVYVHITGVHMYIIIYIIFVY